MKNNNKGIRVLLADDHKILLEGLRELLAKKFDVVATAGGGLELVSLSLLHKPDIVITDINMPDLSGPDAVRQILAAGVPVRPIFLTMLDDPKIASRAFQAGGPAVGYVLKSSASIELATAIEEVMSGHNYITPRISGDLLRECRQIMEKKPETPTARQTEVLRLIAEGKTMKEVAAMLDISTRTAEAHKYQMMEHLGIKTTAELIQFALQNGLLSSGRSNPPNRPEMR